MQRGEEYETSAFTSVGREAYPPTYADSKRRHLFSTLTLATLNAKIIEYERFLKNEKIWKSPRTLADVALNLTHLRFEAAYQKGPDYVSDWIELEKLDAAANLEDDCPTVEIDTNEIKRLLSED